MGKVAYASAMTDSSQQSHISLDTELALGEHASIIRIVEALLEEAHALHASDIHIDPTRELLRIRLRIDGVLIDYKTIPSKIRLEIISRLKVLSGLRTDEHQAPQDGRFRQTLSTGIHVDIRVSIAPTYHGENAVLRLLSVHSEDLKLSDLGFSPSAVALIQTAISKPNGMILATGPTGSGKTTSLYTLIKMLNKPHVSIVTIEDPIEYSIDNIEQIQVNPRTGLTFATGLRSILRQDPDIIMVGEIRDSETASISVNTALTGHLLLSTLHTNDAATTLPRLIDMGIDPYLVASTINLAIGQRLVRKICESCKTEITLTQAMTKSLKSLPISNPFVAGEKSWYGAGCSVCADSGYVGRISVNEVLTADATVKDAILGRASAGELRKIAVQNGMTTMLEDGIEKVRNGLTTIEEVLRVIHE